MSVIGQEAGIKHGTVKGYKQHRYRQVPACEPCLQAVRDDNARRSAARAVDPPKRSDAQRAWYGGKFQHAPAGLGVARTITAAEEPLPDGTIRGQDLAVGDVIDFLGRHYRVERFEPYSGSLRGVLGEGTRTAISGDWGMTVGPNSVIRIMQVGAA